MDWVFKGPPAGYLEEKDKMLTEITNRQAEIRAEKAQAAAKKAAKPPKPKQAALGPPRQLLGRQSKDDANLKISGEGTVLAGNLGIVGQLLAHSYHIPTFFCYHVFTAEWSCLFLACHQRVWLNGHGLKVLPLCREEEGH